MRQLFPAPSLFDGVLRVVGSHRPNHCDRGVVGGCLQLPRGQPHQFSYNFRWFLYTFSTDQSKNLKKIFRNIQKTVTLQKALPNQLRHLQPKCPHHLRHNLLVNHFRYSEFALGTRGSRTGRRAGSTSLVDELRATSSSRWGITG